MGGGGLSSHSVVFIPLIHSLRSLSFTTFSLCAQVMWPSQPNYVVYSFSPGSKAFTVSWLGGRTSRLHCCGLCWHCLLPMYMLQRTAWASEWASHRCALCAGRTPLCLGSEQTEDDVLRMWEYHETEGVCPSIHQLPAADIYLGTIGQLISWIR